MHKKTAMALTVATILTAYISALTMSNQVFAQPGGWIVDTGVLQGVRQLHVPQVGHEAQADDLLARHEGVAISDTGEHSCILQGTPGTTFGIGGHEGHMR
jgi:hypothetical protein